MSQGLCAAYIEHSDELSPPGSSFLGTASRTTAVSEDAAEQHRVLHRPLPAQRRGSRCCDEAGGTRRSNDRKTGTENVLGRVRGYFADPDGHLGR